MESQHRHQIDLKQLMESESRDIRSKWVNIKADSCLRRCRFVRRFSTGRRSCCRASGCYLPVVLRTSSLHHLPNKYAKANRRAAELSLLHRDTFHPRFQDHRMWRRTGARQCAMTIPQTGGLVRQYAPVDSPFCQRHRLGDIRRQLVLVLMD